MPYEMNPGNDMPHEDAKHALGLELDHICSYLAMGEMWHRKAANECRKLALRGFGRWHEAESCGDADSLTCLSKLVMDKLMYAPKLDMQMVGKAESYSMNNIGDFKAHFSMWSENESELIECLNKAINLSRAMDIELYNKLCHITDEVQNEKMRIRLAHDRLNLGGWQGHDLGVVSMVMHSYFQNEHKQGSMIDLNLG